MLGPIGTENRNCMTEPQTAFVPAVAITASFTAEPLLPALSLTLEAAGLDLKVNFAPYGQLFQQLLTSTSLLATNAHGANVILLRIEDFVREVPDGVTARALIERTARELMDALSQHDARAKSRTVLCVLSPTPSAPKELKLDLEKAAATLTEHARALPGILLLTAGEIDRLASGDKYDVLRDELAHIPYTEEFFAAMALAVARKVHALRVPVHKVLVLDCDNTLWRGVVGEDGVDGIVLPRANLALQRFAVNEHESGTLICLASKNSERDVLEVFERRSDMVLKPEHVVALRINWKSKPENISSLARELNLGLDAFVFIDDNPIECAEMHAALPQVVTLQLPPDGEIEPFLSNLWVFDKLLVTSEDTRRTQMYRENAARQSLEVSTTSIGDFIASLKVAMDIASPADGDWPRLAQLTQRTNQFNFTTVRRTEPEMRASQASGSVVLRVNVSDRFGDYGLVGLIIAVARDSDLVVDTLLLSCRVLGRGVEHAMLARLGELATERGLANVDLPFWPTQKNEPAQAFADSVAAEYKVGDGSQVNYRIPATAASSIIHRPGHDPEAVLRASKSQESKAPAVNIPSDTGSADRSEVYSRLARAFTSGREVLDAVRAKGRHVRTLTGRPREPATDTQRKLAALWQELLNVDKVGIDDDYFALGGTSLLAAQMFAEIAKRFGVRLPLTSILDCPTIRELAPRVEPQAEQRSGILIELKPGGSHFLFLVHDGDGETLLYRNLALRLPDDIAVFGIEPRRLARVPLAHTRIEDMARFYIKEMRSKQPRGPYMLGGLCAGGVIAYEMALQLKSAGETVKLVALLDAAKPRARKRRGHLSKQRVKRLEAVFAGVRGERGIYFSRLYSSIKAALSKLKGFLIWEVSSRAKRLMTKVRFRLLHELLMRGRPWPNSLTALSVREIYDSAEACYLPKALSNSGVMLLRAEAGDEYDQPYREVYADDTFDWKSVASDLTVVDVKGGHSSMLQEPFVESLVGVLTPKVSDDLAVR
jgi:FkbH-like protein